MKPEFPAANVSSGQWNRDSDWLLYVLFEPCIYTPADKLYAEYYLGQSFVDSNGKVFKITGRILPGRLLQVLHFIPNLCRVELLFEPTGRTMDIEEVRSHMLRQLETLDDDEDKAEWIEAVKGAATIKDIISGDR